VKLFLQTHIHPLSSNLPLQFIRMAILPVGFLLLREKKMLFHTERRSQLFPTELVAQIAEVSDYVRHFLA